MQKWITRLFEDKDMLRMGHFQSPGDLNLGMGWLYYGLTRMIRPEKVVVIGSWRGFSPLIFGKALIDNGNGGQVDFIDPSLVDDFWKDAAQVQKHFNHYGVMNIRHHLMTTQEFVESETYRQLDSVGIVFIDGLHTAEQARIDFEAFENRIATDGLFMFHDSIDASKVTWLYGEEGYVRSVKTYIDELKQNDNFQILDLPFAKGLTIARKLTIAHG